MRSKSISTFLVLILVSPYLIYKACNGTLDQEPSEKLGKLRRANPVAKRIKKLFAIAGL